MFQYIKLEENTKKSRISQNWLFCSIWVLGDISGFRQSQISLLIYLLFPVDKSQKLI